MGIWGVRVTFYIESGKSSSYKGRLSCIISINSGEFHEMDLSCSLGQLQLIFIFSTLPYC
ncbi:hypothetical protein ACP8HZ_04010 [Francisella noatunensis]